jgi:hypothetical protein
MEFRLYAVSFQGHARCGLLANVGGLYRHHYIFGLAIIPATAFPTRLSLIYQGLALGLFLNGVARYVEIKIKRRGLGLDQS